MLLLLSGEIQSNFSDVLPPFSPFFLIYKMIDISKDDVLVLSGLPMVPAQNLLEQLGYLGIGSMRIIPRSDVQEQWPSQGTLSSEWYVVWGDTDA